MHEYQKYITTAAYKIAAGITDSTTTKQKPVAQQFSSLITKTFLDSLYAFLDGMVHLASEDSPVSHGLKRQESEQEATGAIPLFDLRQNVRIFLYIFDTTSLFASQDTRLLLVVSNLVHLNESLIPGMLNQFQSSFGIALDDARLVSLILLRAFNDF